MHSKNRAVAALILRTLGFLVGIVGIIMQLCAADVVGGGFMMNHDLAYFTVQTNLFMVVLWGVLLVRTGREYRSGGHLVCAAIHPSLHLACTCYITVTMLGFWLLLAPTGGLPQNPFLLTSTLILHTILPLMALADHVLFAPHGGLSYREVLKWLLYPVLYLVSVEALSGLLRTPYYRIPLPDGPVDLRYPYPFLDPQVVGLRGVVLSVAVLAVFFLLLGLLFIWVDGLLGRRQEATI